MALWDARQPLPIATAGAAAGGPSTPTQNFTLYAAAPILDSGWTLLGDLRKLVPCSPQRIVTPSAGAAPTVSARASAVTQLVTFRSSILGIVMWMGESKKNELAALRLIDHGDFLTIFHRTL